MSNPKINLRFGGILTLVAAFLFGLCFTLATIHEAQAANNVCFCHIKSTPPQTICTDNSGQQNGHIGHGDFPYGCECGDGICDPAVGEDCGTCPTDCGACATCGDGTADEGEECGETDLVCSEGACVGCRCLTTCGDDVVDPGEQCDGDDCCDTDCTLNTGNSCDDTDACTENDSCVEGLCDGDLVDCDDGDSCTDDSCDQLEGCINTSNDDPDCAPVVPPEEPVPAEQPVVEDPTSEPDIPDSGTLSGDAFTIGGCSLIR